MIRQPVYAVISLLLLAVVLYFVANRLVFLHSAKRTMGTVTSLSISNDRCGGRRHRYNCTRFRADVEFQPLEENRKYTLDISAGSTRGHNASMASADHHVGENVSVVYNPKNPGESYEDSFTGVWGTPFMILIFQIGSFIASLTEPKRREGSLNPFST